METPRDKDQKKEQRTPIIDGDARPDQMIETDTSSGKNKKQIEKENEVTSNRSADVNSLEDYKDAN